MDYKKKCVSAHFFLCGNLKISQNYLRKSKKMQYFCTVFYTLFPKGHPKVAHRSPIGRTKVNHKCYKGAPEVKRDHYVRTLHYIHTTELTAIKARLKSEKLKKCAKNALFLCIKTQMTYFGSKKAKNGSILWHNSLFT